MQDVKTYNGKDGLPKDELHMADELVMLVHETQVGVLYQCHTV